MAKDAPASAPDSLGEQLVAQGATVIRYENDQMSAFAIQNPRVETDVKQRALEILEADAEVAELAFYSIPFKKHSRSGNCTGLANDNCPIEQEVEGVGIDGARELARLWGNNQSRVYFTEEDEEWIRMSGSYVDLETNARLEVPYAVSKYAVKRDGSVYTLNPQRLAMAVQAGVSKCARNAISQGLPSHLVRAYYRKAKEVVGKTSAVDVPKLVEAFATYNVEREQLEGFYGCPLEDLTTEQRRNLRGLFVAIREKLVDPEEYFRAGGGGGGTQEPHPAAAESGVPSSSPAPRAEVTGGTQAEPADQPSNPTRGGVESETPNDDAEPEQAGFDDFGI